MCEGTGSQTYTLTPDIGSSDTRRGRIAHTIGQLCSHLFRVRTACSNCEGTGTVEQTREKSLEDLSTLQQTFLFEADLHRETPDEETQRKIEEMKEQADGPATGGHPTPQQAPSPGQIPSGQNPPRTPR